MSAAATASTSTATATATATSEEYFAGYEACKAAALTGYANAYCPYSKYHVGCGLLTASGAVISGANVENASYGLTICAERTALCAAAAQGHRDFAGMVVATKDGGSCCGACRQFIREFFGPATPIIFITAQGTVVDVTDIDRLLPRSFGPENLA